MGVIGNVLTSDGQQFIVHKQPSIIIGQTAVWAYFHIWLFIGPFH